ncbi:methyltransferase domain-containing protein [Phlyctema vagabunda]|uniref:Methyltransferase domain-containing protein n=1 Tax=Phlyctema vagabunda TaxID=108571 RepID=A0ABR4PN72_9HELO
MIFYNSVPPNLRFQIDDLEETWTFTNKFDFIYSRMMTGSFSDWPLVLNQAYQNLNPGGFIEIMDCIYPTKTDDDTFPENSMLRKWGELMLTGFAATGRPLDSALHSRELLEAAGFVNVVQADYKWPLNQWPKHERSKELGLWAFESLYWGIEGLSLAVFTRALRWTKEETMAFLVEVKKEIKDTKIHCYIPGRVIYGQRPMETPAA